MNMDSGLTSAQARVCFHQDRLFRSTGGGVKAHRAYTRLCRNAGLPEMVDQMIKCECITALQLMEEACQTTGMSLFRDTKTDWQQLEAVK